MQKTLKTPLLKVFVHFNHDRDESYFFTFNEEINLQKLTNVVERGYNHAIGFLMKNAKKKIFVFPKERQKARLLADVSLAHGYIIERLV